MQCMFHEGSTVSEAVRFIYFDDIDGSLQEGGIWRYQSVALIIQYIDG